VSPDHDHDVTDEDPDSDDEGGAAVTMVTVGPRVRKGMAGLDAISLDN
jgi:hypothetical protein